MKYSKREDRLLHHTPISELPEEAQSLLKRVIIIVPKGTMGLETLFDYYCRDGGIRSVKESPQGKTYHGLIYPLWQDTYHSPRDMEERHWENTVALLERKRAYWLQCKSQDPESYDFEKAAKTFFWLCWMRRR